MTAPAVWFWIDTSWACALLATDVAGVVVWAAPIFRNSAMGRPLNAVIRAWRRRAPVRWHRYSEPFA